MYHHANGTKCCLFMESANVRFDPIKPSGTIIIDVGFCTNIIHIYILGSSLIIMASLGGNGLGRLRLHGVYTMCSTGTFHLYIYQFIYYSVRVYYIDEKRDIRGDLQLKYKHRRDGGGGRTNAIKPFDLATTRVRTSCEQHARKKNCNCWSPRG